MGQPKKRRSKRKQGLHRSHLVSKLAKRVNKTSPVKVRRGDPPAGGSKKTAQSGE